MSNNSPFYLLLPSLFLPNLNPLTNIILICTLYCQHLKSKKFQKRRLNNRIKPAGIHIFARIFLNIRNRKLIERLIVIFNFLHIYLEN